MSGISYTPTPKPGRSLPHHLYPAETPKREGASRSRASPNVTHTPARAPSLGLQMPSSQEAWPTRIATWIPNARFGSRGRSSPNSAERPAR